MPIRVRGSRVALGAAEILLAGAISIHLGSCSVLMPVAAVRTNNRFPRGDLERTRIAELPGHPRVRIVTVQGDTLEGRFVSLRALPPEEYRVRYEAWRAAGHSELPPLEEAITLIPARGRSRSGPFAGFGFKTAWLRIGRFDDGEFPLASLDRVRRADGSELRADSLLAMGNRNQLPSRFGARLSFARGVPAAARRYALPNTRTALIPVDEVRAVSIVSQVASPAASFVGGAALDALGLLAVAAAAGGGTGSGCAYDPSGISWGGSTY